MMRDLAMTGTLPAPDSRWLRKLADATGGALPPDYIAFLRQHNGGHPAPGVFQRPGDCPDNLFWIDYFCSLGREVLSGSEDSDYRSLAFSHHRYAQIMPEGCLIIARASRDDFVVLFYRGPRAGRVFYKHMWDLVDMPPDQWPAHPEMGLHFVAPSFAAFLDMLMEDPGFPATAKAGTNSASAKKGRDSKRRKSQARRPRKRAARKK